jgi:hypothetical protein
MLQSPQVSSSTVNSDKRPFQFSIRSLLLFTFMFALLCSGLSTLYKLYNTHFVAYWEPVESSSDWQQPLQFLLKDAKEKQIEIKQLKVFDLKNRPDMWGPENVWQMESTPELLDLITKCWQLIPINRNNKWVERYLSKMREDWRPRNPNCEIEYFASQGRLMGNKSDLYVVMNDKTHKQIVVWYYFNF